MTTTCSVSDCSNPVHAVGMCSKHRSRWARHQRTERLTLSDRFTAHYTVVGECWVWDRPRVDGYGQFNGQYAHRWAYEHFIGPIPDGLAVDHQCHNADPDCPGGYTCQHRRCVNPAHLEPATSRDNLLRGFTIAAKNAAKTECIHGHQFTTSNTYVTKNGRRRQCRTCLNNRSRAYYQRRSEKENERAENVE